MKILHHVDDDGFCSAAIVNWLIKPYGVNLTDEDCILYNYNGPINIPEFKEGEYVYIVDISLDNEVFKFIKEAVRNKCRVLHIDHHKTTIEWLNNCKGTQKRVLDKITKFYNTKVSASMLCYIYSSASAYLNQNNNINFFIDQDTFYVNDAPEETTAKGINGPVPHKIPPIVMYVDDYDTSADTKKLLDEIKSYCISNRYEFVFFCRDVEDVYWGKRVNKSEKIRMAASFNEKHQINSIKESQLRRIRYIKNSSNILSILDKYLTKKR